MRKLVAFFLMAVVCLSFALFQGCEWDDTGSSSFNTSQGGGMNINFSGYYRPRSGAFLVTSNITHFVLTQIGNSLEVYDNNNSYYTGSIGSPGSLAKPDFQSGAYPPGAEMLQAQVSFAGVNALTGLEVSFVGIIHVVAVDSVNSTESVQDTTSYSNFDVINTNTPGVTVGFGDTSNLTTTVTSTYALTEENSQYVLDGNWIEGGMVTGISAIAPSVASTFSLSSTGQGLTSGGTTTSTTTSTP